VSIIEEEEEEEEEGVFTIKLACEIN